MYKRWSGHGKVSYREGSIPSNAVNALAELKLRTAGTQTIAEALAEVRNIGAMIVRALNPQYEVKERVE